MKTLFPFLCFLFCSIFLQAQTTASKDLLLILETYFSKTNSTSALLNPKGSFLRANRTFRVLNDTLWIYVMDPQDAFSNAPKNDTSFVYLPDVEKINIENGSSTFSSKGLSIQFTPRVYQSINSKKTGSTTSKDIILSEKQISQIQGANITQKIAGQAAGVFVGGSSTPGSTTMVRIRGIGSINANSPLYIVDDVPISQSNINSINPEDIESVQVLKDASSTALYGVRGANGVVVIKTKKGNPSIKADELNSIPKIPIVLWIWDEDVARFKKDKVQKLLKSFRFQ